MLTRRAFTGVVSCAVCAMASEFMATEAAAQATPPAATAGVTRKILSQTDGPAAGYETLLVEATIEAGGAGGRAPHPRHENPPLFVGGLLRSPQRTAARPNKKKEGLPTTPPTPPTRGEDAG